MADYQKQIDNLQLRLEDLIRRQEFFSAEINDLRSKIDSLRGLVQGEVKPKAKIVWEEIKPVPARVESVPEPIAETPVIHEHTIPVPETINQPSVPKPAPVNTASKEGLEKYIGQNLIPVIGIIITVIGVGIGAKYAIDHHLVSPLTRILLGYLMGGGLLFFALRLRKKYKDFSAVLLSGSMAIFYFITFFAYNFYGLIPLPAAFLLMVVITGSTVYSAIKYNLPVIAHIGLVGAYAVPFLLSDDSGKIGIFFSYMAIINIGILAVSFFRNWKSLYFVTFGFTWFIYVAWFVTQYHDQFKLSFIFLLVFFLVFHAVNLAYKLIKKEIFNEVDGLMILLNSFIFYGMGITLISQHAVLDKYLGWFTLFNALIHLLVSGLLYLRKSGDRKLISLSTGLALTFVTIFVPVQLGGNWVTLLWVFEAGLLFWIGRTQAGRIYEIFSYPVLFAAFICLLFNWLLTYSWKNEEMTPFLNIQFLSSALFGTVLVFMYRISGQEKYVPAYKKNPGMLYFMKNLVFVLLIAVAFFGIQLEISFYWKSLYRKSVDFALDRDYFIERGNTALYAAKIISNVLYALIFVTILGYFKRKTKNTEEFNLMFYMAFLFVVLCFLTVGLYQLNSLHLKYLARIEGQIYYRGAWLIGIRYISYAVLGVAVFQLTKFVDSQMPWKSMKILSEYVLHTVIVWCCSAELVNWMHSMHSAQSYKLTLSIFAGLYALFLIVLGIWKKKSYLRIGAISLFGITLMKLFFYDISQMDTIFKTIVFISLGILLLVIAFLYNKYKGRMFEEE